MKKVALPLLVALTLSACESERTLPTPTMKHIVVDLQPSFPADTSLRMPAEAIAVDTIVVKPKGN